MVLQTRIFFLVNHFSRTIKKVDLYYKTTFFSGQPLFSNHFSQTRFLEPYFSNQISTNSKNQGRRINGPRPECILCTTNSDEKQHHFLWEWSKLVLNVKLRTFGFHYDEPITTQLDIEWSMYCDWLIAMACIGMGTRCSRLYSSPAHKETIQ